LEKIGFLLPKRASGADGVYTPAWFLVSSQRTSGEPEMT
tara:strand:- start:2862 stop:2978 length:117 start_codon:yes stop_codon:yes gene_type:complete